MLFDLINIIVVHLYMGFILIVISLSHAGPVLPQQPTNLMDIGTDAMSTLIRWMVPIIAYTPETYVVNYGTSMGSLAATSATCMVRSGSDFEAVNQVFLVALTGLVDSTTYFYQVVATNVQGSTSSDVQSFSTTVLRKLFIALPPLPNLNPNLIIAKLKYRQRNYSTQYYCYSRSA